MGWSEWKNFGGGNGGTLLMENVVKEKPTSNTTSKIYASKMITAKKAGKVGIVFTHFTDGTSAQFTLTKNDVDISEEITKDVSTIMLATHGTALIDCEVGDVIIAISSDSGYSSTANRYATVDVFYLE